MAEFPGLTIFTDAYIADTTHLTTLEHGAYWLLLIAAWRSSDTSLPDDDRRLARLTKLTPNQWARIRPTLAEFFVIRDGRWVQRRLTDEAAFVRQKREKQAKAGRASAQRRKGRHSDGNEIPPPGAVKREGHRHDDGSGAKTLETSGAIPTDVGDPFNGRATPTPTPTPSPTYVGKDSAGAESLSAADAADAAAAEEKRKRAEEAAAAVAASIWTIYACYNQTAEACGLPVAKWPLSDSRKKMVKARLKEHGETAMLEAIRSIPHRRFLGTGTGKWRADFGKLMRQETFTALLEGRYDHEKSAYRAGERGEREFRDPLMRELFGRPGSDVD